MHRAFTLIHRVFDMKHRAFHMMHTNSYMYFMHFMSYVLLIILQARIISADLHVICTRLHVHTVDKSESRFLFISSLINLYSLYFQSVRLSAYPFNRLFVCLSVYLSLDVRLYKSDHKKNYQEGES